MGLNIKNERVHELAREAARRTGRSQTAVIEMALERLLEDVPVSGASTRAEEVATFLEHLRVTVTDEDRAAMRQAMEEMYDEETGLPR